VFSDDIRDQQGAVLSFQTQQTYEHVCYSWKKERWREKSEHEAQEEWLMKTKWLTMLLS